MLYAIPCTWTVTGETFIKANNLEEAKRIALEDAPLPSNSEYLDDSFQINDDAEVRTFKTEEDLIESGVMQSGDKIVGT